MDTILFFYRKRDLEKALVEPVGLKSHMLIRVGLNVGEGEWFGRRTDFSSYRKADEAAGNIAGPGGRRTAGGDLEPETLPGKKRERQKSGGFWRSILKFPTRYPGERRGEREGEKRAHRKRENGKWEQRKRENEKREQRKSRKQESRDAAELRRLRAEWEESIRNIEQEILKIASEIPELAGEESRCYAVYEDSVRKVLLRAEEDAAVNRDAFMEQGGAGGRDAFVERGGVGDRDHPGGASGIRRLYGLRAEQSPPYLFCGGAYSAFFTGSGSGKNSAPDHAFP